MTWEQPEATLVFYRLEDRQRYLRERARGRLIVPHGRCFEPFSRYEETFDAVLNEAQQSGISLEEVIEPHFRATTFPGEAAPFWAYFCEQVRSQQHRGLPSRLDSVFALARIEDAERLARVFKTESALLGSAHPYRLRDQVVYEALCEGPQCELAFDMNIIDGLELDLTYEDAVGTLNLYWCCGRSETPVLELLLTGDVRRGEIAKEF